jgi:serine O-acetyltransferase
VRIGHVQRYRLARAWGVFAHPKASIGEVRFPHPSSIIIGAHSVIEDHCIIYQQVTIGSKDNDRREYPVIRRGARIFAGSIVIGAVEVGEDAIVGANSVVVHDVPAGATVVGNPARMIAASTGSAP